MMIFKSSLFLFFMAMGFSYGAHAECLNQADVTSVLSEIQLKSSNLNVKIDKLELCNPQALTTKILKALIFLKKNGELPHLNSIIDQNIIGDNAWDFFKKRVNTINFRADDEDWCGYSTLHGLQAAAYAGKGDSSINICSSMSAYSDIFIVSSLIHEARHNDSEGYDHSDCEQGPLKGAGRACDSSYDFKGSYAVEAEFKIRLSQKDNVNPVIRSNAKAEAVETFVTRFNKLPFKISRGLLLKDDHGNLKLKLGSQLISLQSGGAENLILVQRGSSNIIYNPNSLTSFAYNMAWSNGSGNLSIMFSQNKPETYGKNLIDVLYGPVYSCFLSSHELSCANNSDLSYHFTKIPLAHIQAAGIFRIDNGVQVGLVDEKGQVYELPETFEGLKKLTESTLQKISSPVIRSIYDGFDLYGLDHSGQLMKYDTNVEAWKIMAETKGLHFKSLAPTYDSPVIRSL